MSMNGAPIGLGLGLADGSQFDYMRHSGSPSVDPFEALQEATRQHRARHGCGAYTYDDGSLPGVLAAAVGARRIVEVGTALGYTACWLASAHDTTAVDTIESDPEHVELARTEIARYGLDDRVSVHHGDAESVLADLDESAYDVAFFDGFAPTLAVVGLLRSRLRPGGLLIAANLTLGGAGAVRTELADVSLWRTHSFGETALAVKTTEPDLPLKHS